jgi:DNA-directed RNA polymerase subunit E'/Rpb7
MVFCIFYFSEDEVMKGIVASVVGLGLLANLTLVSPTHAVSSQQTVKIDTAGEGLVAKNHVKKKMYKSKKMKMKKYYMKKKRM